jgi:hypothetical protein
LCASSGDGEGGGQQGAATNTTKSKTQCENLAEIAGRTASRVAAGMPSADPSAQAAIFAVSLGAEAAGITNPLAVFGIFGRASNVVPGDQGGYADELGGNNTGQARHFAATVYSVAQVGSFVAERVWRRRERGEPDDWALSQKGIQLMRDLSNGSVRMSGRAVQDWTLTNLCKDKQ